MRNLLLLSLLLNCLFSLGQQDSLYKKKQLPKHQIKALLGFLNQDGNHSAVTGGEGTEDLKVHSVRVSYSKKTKNGNKWIIKPGIDNVSSASTDKIDFVESSASRHDFRGQLNVGFNKISNSDSSTVGVNVSSSLESDYLSRGIGALYKKKNKYGGITQFKLNFFWDELRWGLVNVGIFDFTTMVYPFELRDSSWFNISHRNTLTFSGKHSFISSYRSRLGIMFDVTYQQGITGTPFHRVYDKFGGLRVESLPIQRVKIPISVQYNYFAGSRLVIKNYVRYSWDSFGISGITYKLQTPIKYNYRIWFKPFVRFYYQDQAKYFQPFMKHDFKTDEFYTSDYDLSQFWAVNYGLGIKVKKKASWKNINGLEWLIENYNREDGLYFWQTSFMIDFSF